jgi:hypothetical protein
MHAVWGKLNTQLCSECKSTLQVVKAVAGKYRMTNKPPPDAASSYVKTILQPIKTFLANHSLMSE